MPAGDRSNSMVLLALGSAVISASCDDAPCTRWCKAQAPCYLEGHETNLGAILDGDIRCELSSKSRAIRECSGQCFEIIERDRVRFTGDAEACLACMSDNLERSCTESSDWADCAIACERTRAPLGSYELSQHASCWQEGDRPMECEPGPRRPAVSFDNMFGPHEGLPDYSDVAIVLAESPLVLALTDGSTITVRLSDVPIAPLAVGATIQVAFEAICPWWCNFQLVARALDGSLLFAAWSTGGVRAPLLPELDLAYQATPCASTREQCGQYLGTSLVSSAIAIDPGYEAMVGPYLVINGHSNVEFDTSCTDHPGGWSSGAVVPQSGP